MSRSLGPCVRMSVALCATISACASACSQPITAPSADATIAVVWEPQIAVCGLAVFPLRECPPIQYAFAVARDGALTFQDYQRTGIYEPWIELLRQEHVGG